MMASRAQPRAMAAPCMPPATPARARITVAGIFHFVTTLSVQDFAQAVSVALPHARMRHSEGEVLLLDTPTLALRRGGWLLIAASTTGETSLSLRHLKRQTSLTVPAPARLPEAVHDIIALPLRQRLERQIGDSRLLVVHRWRERGLRYECLNDADKVECTLVAHQYHAIAPGSQASPVVIELIAKRGYESETSALACALEKRLAWRALEGDGFELLENLHLAAVTSPGLGASPLRQTAAAIAVASVLLDHHATMCATVVSGTAPEAHQLHELRVAMRHSRSLLRAYRGLLGRDLERHFQGEFRWLSAATRRLRDIDVLHAALLAPAPDYVVLAKRERKRLANFVECERARDAARLQRVLAGARYADLRRVWPLALAAVIAATTPDAPPIGEAVAAAIRKALAGLRRDASAVAADYTPTALHQLRKQCKRLRYLVAPCASLYPRERIAAVQSALKQLQTLLGKSCDRHAQLALLKGHLWRRAKGQPALRAALKNVRRALREHLVVCDVDTLLRALDEFDNRHHHVALDALFGMPEL